MPIKRNPVFCSGVPAPWGGRGSRLDEESGKKWGLGEAGAASRAWASLHCLRTPRHVHVCIHPHISMRVYTSAYVRTHQHTCTYTTHTAFLHKHQHVQTYQHSCTHTSMQVHITHTHTSMHVHTHMHQHSCTHTPACLSPFLAQEEKRKPQATGGWVLIAYTNC